MAAANISGARRKLKNVAYNYTPTQVKVREATSNDPWGPSSSLMSEIADLTNNPVAFTEIMEMVWKRINDHGKNWRHVYKSLVLLDYLIKCGSEKVAQQCVENIYTIETLKDFQHIEDNKDQGHNIRTKAAQMVAFLKDDEKLKNERAKAQMARKRFAQNNIGISSDGSTSHGQGLSGGARRRTQRADSELEEARPTSIGEEELQLQIALALSREEAEKEDEARKGATLGDDIRYQMALEESKNESVFPGVNDAVGGEARASSPVPGTSQSALDDLLGLTAPSAAANDPWAPPVQQQPAAQQAPNNSMYPSVPPPYTSESNNDPWGAPASTAQPPQQQPVIGIGSIATNDPWAPVTSTTTPAMSTNSTPAINHPQQTSMLGAPAGDNDPWAPVSGGQEHQTSGVSHSMTNGGSASHLNEDEVFNSEFFTSSTKELARSMSPRCEPPISVVASVSSLQQQQQQHPPPPPPQQQQQHPPPQQQQQQQQQHTNNQPSNVDSLLDVWSMDALSQSMNTSGTNNATRSQDLQAKRASTKTPENFLGENSALVNLDDLMGPSKPPVPGMGPSKAKSASATPTPTLLNNGHHLAANPVVSASTNNSNSSPASNPFLSSTGPAVQPTPVANPFLANQRPSPTLNQMRQPMNAVAPPNVSSANWSASSPGLQSPMQPSSAVNNPFA